MSGHVSASDILAILAITCAAPAAVILSGVLAYLLWARRWLNGRNR